MSQRIKTPEVKAELRKLRKLQKKRDKMKAIEEGRRQYEMKEFRRAVRKAEREAARREERGTADVG